MKLKKCLIAATRCYFELCGAIIVAFSQIRVKCVINTSNQFLICVVLFVATQHHALNYFLSWISVQPMVQQNRMCNISPQLRINTSHRLWPQHGERMDLVKNWESIMNHPFNRFNAEKMRWNSHYVMVRYDDASSF